MLQPLGQNMSLELRGAGVSEALLSDRTATGRALPAPAGVTQEKGQDTNKTSFPEAPGGVTPTVQQEDPRFAKGSCRSELGRNASAAARVQPPCLPGSQPPALALAARASRSCTMKGLLCGLLLLSLLSSVSSSCEGDCLTCREKLRPALDSFNLEVCVLECQGQTSASPRWTPCAEAMAGGPWQPGRSDPKRAAARSASEPRHLKRMPRVRSVSLAQPDGAEAEAGQKQLQKRFGGFTGARKSARKLASQKRFGEFMRQYLVLSLRSSQRRRALQNRRA
ncbi:Prepronociceptin [Galemys pyrenaicus]|uniref:Prepronociceptin n=1 Tax=Galemys pyrenaicus TaxID=202257 RepID=A0A8J5ZU53_GALPY|nr:Prepronociceptin [Galemys pyrenaicus]